MFAALSSSAMAGGTLAWLYAPARFRRPALELRRRLAALGGGAAAQPLYDRGRELRAEARARALLRSCVNSEEWAMYRDLGFLVVPGAAGAAPAEQPSVDYFYVLYPHKPIVAVLGQSRQLVGEYCVTFANRRGVARPPRLPDADDVLAKWMMLCADERGLLAQANVHLPGRQVDPRRVIADVERLERWRRLRAERPRGRAALALPGETAAGAPAAIGPAAGPIAAQSAAG